MTITTNGTSNWSTVLKTLWKDDYTELYYEGSPLLAALPKKTDWTGNALRVPIQFGQVAGVSGTFSDARALSNAPKFAEMSVQIADAFGVFQVDHKLIQLSKNDKGAIVRALEAHSKSCFKKMKRVQSCYLYGNGGGAIGRVSMNATTATANVLYFSNARPLRYLDIGDRVNFSIVDGTSGSLLSQTGNVDVIAVNPENNSVTVGGNVTTNLAAVIDLNTNASTLASWVFLKGSHGATSAQTVIQGVESYVTPNSSPGTIWGMTRTTNPQRLAGVRVGGKNLLKHEAVKKALKVTADAGAGVPDKIFCSTQDFMDIELALGTTIQRAEMKIAGVGFEGVKISSPGGKPVELYPDADCPDNILWGLKMDAWTLHSAGQFPDFLMYNRQYEVMDTDNALEGRIGGYAQLYCDAPGLNFRLDLTAT